MKLQTFIQSLNDFELASMAKFQMGNLPASQREKIDAELKKRGITDVEVIFSSQSSGATGEDICSQCTCNRLWVSEGDQWKPDPEGLQKIRSLEIACMICGYR